MSDLPIPAPEAEIYEENRIRYRRRCAVCGGPQPPPFPGAGGTLWCNIPREQPGSVANVHRYHPEWEPHVTVYAVRPGREHDIAPGSGIVGQGGVGGILCYYEGAVHGQQMTYAEKVRHAAGRMVARYPTIALKLIPKDDLVVVGEWNGYNVEVSCETALRVWLGADVTPDQLCVPD